ncbi:MAG: ATP-binding cassette domain-containing protein [Armatimonadetes bacterium]|nr:ATP-binding cassette domain-containing protein [Armatimonadota bacterium]
MSGVLEIKNLTRCFGSFVAVNEVSFSVGRGEMFGLLGPNGAGKSTTLKMLTTLLSPTSGTAKVAGLDIVRQAGAVRRVIGYVPQGLSSDGALSGYENLLIFAKLYDLPRKEREDRVRAALQFMGLDGAADKMVRDYSGGMIRRLEIAQSVLHRPPMLFLDEPTVGLDPLARKAVWDNLRQLQSEAGVTLLLTTHHMEEAEQLCDRVAIMHRAKVVAIGSPNELKSAMGNPNATLDEVFIHFTGDRLDDDLGGNYRDTARARRTARRVG